MTIDRTAAGARAGFNGHPASANHHPAVGRPPTPDDPPVDIAKLSSGAATTEIGVGGVLSTRGEVIDEVIRELSGPEGRRILRTMRETDTACSAVTEAIHRPARAVDWQALRANDTPAAEEMAELVTEALGLRRGMPGDMSHSFGDFIGDALTCTTYGWAMVEVVWKRRIGPEERDPSRRSKFTDGLLMPRKMVGRDQHSLARWEVDATGGIQGMWQRNALGGPDILIPIERGLLIRTSREHGSPEGFSLLKPAYNVWRQRLEIEQLEGIGIRRDYVGVPVVYADPHIWEQLEDPDPVIQARGRARLANARKIVSGMERATGQAGVVFNGAVFTDPDTAKPTGMRKWHMELLSASSSRNQDTSGIITRKTQEMLRALLAHFLALGSNSMGSFALSKSQTDLFLRSIEYLLDQIQDVLNRHLIERIWSYNQLPRDLMPKVVHGEVAPPVLSEVGALLRDAAAAGITFAADDGVEDVLRRIAGFPELTAEQKLARQEEEETRREAALAGMEALAQGGAARTGEGPPRRDAGGNGDGPDAQVSPDEQTAASDQGRRAGRRSAPAASAARARFGPRGARNQT